MSVLDEIAAERRRQDEKWGGPDHDDRHTVSDWAGLFDERIDKITAFSDLSPQPRETRQQMVILAALAVAAIESFDREAGSPSAQSDVTP